MCPHRYFPQDDEQRVADEKRRQPPPLGLEKLFGGPPQLGKLMSLEYYDKRYLHDPDRKPLDIMSYTVAYFRVAYKRIIDIVPMCIENLYILKFWKALRDGLEVKLGLYGDKAAENYARFAAEESDSQEKREKLVEMKAKLSEGLEIIAEL